MEEKKETKKEKYERPEVKTQIIEMGAFGAYGSSSPVPSLQPFFGLCCN